MIGIPSCRGCTYSGHPHNEDCPQAMHIKYPEISYRPSRYYKLPELMTIMTHRNHAALVKLMDDHGIFMNTAKGSSKNHQAWEGGYLHHVVETMNICVWLHDTSPRKLSFSRAQALEVMFLHDLEKPWKHLANVVVTNEMPQLVTKEQRKAFRTSLIEQYGIQLNEEQKNALRYVEGIPDSEYVPGERIMGEMAAFCHCCDILSARLWHNKGSEGAWK